MAHPLHDDLGIRLGLAYTAFVDRLNADMAAAGFDDLGPTYGYLFRALASAPTTLSTLADGLHMTTQGVAKILAEMESKGYLRRTPHPTDARARLIELADRGRRALRTASGLHDRFERDLAAKVGDDDAAALRRCLDAVLDMGSVDPASRLLRPI
jgi:DNA-binding MarR family transcriptional regulator